MSKHCPSCGSVVDETMESCPVCGEDLTQTIDDTSRETPERPDRPSATPVAAIPTAAAGGHIPPGSSPAPGETAAKRLVCPECGATNPLGATECSTCGASLAGATAGSTRAQTTAATATPAAKGSTVQTYVIAGLAMIVIALVIYIATAPKDPPAADPHAGVSGMQGGQGQLPADHPPIDESAQMEALRKHVADLEAKVAADPENDSLQLALANGLYDIGEHGRATAHYRNYLAKHPENLDATTDYATSIAAAGNNEPATDSAIVVLNGVLAKSPKHQRAAFNMAIMYRQKENRDSIIYWLQRVVEMDSTTATGQTAAGVLKEYQNIQAP